VRARRRARPRSSRRDGGPGPRRDDDGRRFARAAIRASRGELDSDDGRRRCGRGGSARAVLLGAGARADAAVPGARRMSEHHHRPVDARVIPRFAGVRTFLRLPHTTDLAGVDAAAIGIPFDTATSYRAGARFGPEAIRSASALLRPFHPGFGIDLVETLSIVDYGDLPVAPGDTEGTYRGVEEGLGPVVEAGVFPLVPGRDHSTPLAALRQLSSTTVPR